MKKLVNRLQSLFGCMFPHLAVRIVFLRKFGRLPDLRNPSDLNEKIQWLKFHGDMSVWAELADKYLVRNYVASKGLGDLLVPLYGKFGSVKEFAAAWDSLEAPFVVKTNNACKEVIFVRDKSAEDVSEICGRLRKWLSDRTFWGFFVEPHYRLIKPCIMVERFLAEGDSADVLPVDYKIWCFNGRPEFIFTCSGRDADGVDIDCFDTGWNEHREHLVFSGHFRRPAQVLPRPESLDKMLEYASVLCKGFPQVRVDLYNINGRIFFGEMTFTSNGGFMTYFTPSFLKETGARCTVR
jgi:hypothetical protein